nr:MAG TPA: hypothetical protein [Caudoviricetes sp.]
MNSALCFEKIFFVTVKAWSNYILECTPTL